MAVLDVTVLVPIRTVSESNSREFWAKRAARAQVQRRACALAVRSALAGTMAAIGVEHVSVSLARISPRELDDDNLRGALKACRDGVTDALGLTSDRNPRVSWLYYQRKGDPKQQAVEVRITGNLPGPD